MGNNAVRGGLLGEDGFRVGVHKLAELGYSFDAMIYHTQIPELTELARVWQGARHVAQSAATIGLVAPVLEDEHRRQGLRYDLGQATMDIMLAAADLGIGSGHASVADQDLARQLLGLPEDRFLAYLIALGYPADRPLAPIARPDRRPFEDVVHWDRW
jgi:nitroreductase